MLADELQEELHRLETETFEIEDLVGAGQDEAGAVVPLTYSCSSSTSCSSTTSCSCSCSSTCSSSCSSTSSIIT